ncbi:MAG: hypothetical protein JW744_01265 [Candidatus Diapherotrites archaeon]|uniref:Uncharacterized protein n=1 Tax=Candidatus Iainarchaeum sp. TaxID=3101447 RepID=A0A938YXD8_9ARCH|nr:hypothetical protein [Candidatus Diapherotrites archaeon]
MGLFDRIKAKKEGMEAQKGKQKAPALEGKYSEACALCGGTGTEKKWMGQYWHKKCVRIAKKGAKKMI